MLELNQRNRTAIVFAACVCFAGAFALAPSSARSAAALRNATARTSDVPRPASNKIDIIAARRDPFAGRPEDNAGGGATASVSTAVAPVPTGAFRPGDIPPLPSNLGAGIPDIPGTTGSMPRIAAVVTGGHPYALVTTGALSAIKGVGDTIDGARVIGIDAGGVTLEGRRRLALATVERTSGDAARGSVPR